MSTYNVRTRLSNGKITKKSHQWLLTYYRIPDTEAKVATIESELAALQSQLETLDTSFTKELKNREKGIEELYQGEEIKPEMLKQVKKTMLEDRKLLCGAERKKIVSSISRKKKQLYFTDYIISDALYGGPEYDYKPSIATKIMLDNVGDDDILDFDINGKQICNQ